MQLESRDSNVLHNNLRLFSKWISTKIAIIVQNAKGSQLIPICISKTIASSDVQVKGLGLSERN